MRAHYSLLKSEKNTPRLAIFHYGNDSINRRLGLKSAEKFAFLGEPSFRKGRRVQIGNEWNLLDNIFQSS